MKKSISVSNLTLDLYLDYVRPAAIAAGIIELTVTEDGKQVYVTDTATADEIAHCMYCACMCAGNDGIERTHEEYVRHEAERMIGQLEVSIKYDLHNTVSTLTALLDAMTAAMQPAPAQQPTTTDEQKEEENTMKPTTTPEAAAILAINPAIFKGLHIKLGFDFQQPVTIRRIPAPFTIKKAWKTIGTDHTPDSSTAAIIMRDTGNTWSIYRDLHMAPITADNLRDDYDDHGMSYSLGRAHGYKTVFSNFYAKGTFHDLRKSPTCEAWIIAQHNDLLKPWTKPARDWTQRQPDMIPGEHKQHRTYYNNAPDAIIIDKSNYRVDNRRFDLKQRARKLRADRQKAAADAATIATAASRYNDLLKAFSAAKQRIITALANVDPLTLSPAAVTKLETIGKAIGEYAWKGLSEAARDINQFEAAARDNKFTTPARYDAAYNGILEKLAAILPEDASTAKEAV